MAIIKCPECGHQISDMAGSCPNCGVAIHGNIRKCPKCGNIHLKGQTFCPVCGESCSNVASAASGNFTATTGSSASKESLHVDNDVQQQEPKKSKKGLVVSIVIVIAVLVGGLCWYASSMNNPRGNEEDAYLNAMESTDVAVLQDYLENYKDAPQEHIDSIQAHIKILQQNDSEWTNAFLSNSKSMLQAYLDKHPESLHRAEAEHKIDSLDWAFALKQNTPEAFESYLTDHSEGEYVVEAQEKMKKLDATMVNSEDKALVSSVFKQFFNGINANDEMGITSVVSSTLNFLTNANATKHDVITFLHKLYKEDVKGMNWRPNGDYKITKKDNGDESCEFDVEFTVDQSVSNVDSSKDKFNQYKVKGHIDADGKISSLQLVKIE